MEKWTQQFSEMGSRNKKTGKCERKSTSKKCPEGKHLNPKTNRCIKNKPSDIKKCPTGKLFNPKTNDKFVLKL